MKKSIAETVREILTERPYLKDNELYLVYLDKAHNLQRRMNNAPVQYNAFREVMLIAATQEAVSRAARRVKAYG
jgi:hypothetical protein